MKFTKNWKHWEGRRSMGWQRGKIERQRTLPTKQSKLGVVRVPSGDKDIKNGWN